MSECRLCGREVTSSVCPACGTPVAESVPWAPLDTGDPAATPQDAPPAAAPSSPEPIGPAAPPPGAQNAWNAPYQAPAPSPAPAPQPGTGPYPPTAELPPVAAHSSQAPYRLHDQQGHPAQPGPGDRSPQPPYPAAGGAPSRRLLPAIAGVLALALVVVGVLVAQQFLNRGRPATARPTTPPATTASQPAPPADPTTSRPAPPPTAPTLPAPPPEQQALTTLQQRAGAGLAQLDPAIARRAWVAQLSSKSVGITDPRQTAANGTHVFYAVDILAEHEQLRGRVRDATVVLADSTSYGERKTDPAGRPYWRTIALGDAFTSRDAVNAWCARTFPELTGENLTNQCVATQL